MEMDLDEVARRRGRKETEVEKRRITVGDGAARRNREHVGEGERPTKV